ncbi:DNA polymerase subunit gamma-1, mitochondrial isoform X2 [Anthonomus grandis grandis]|uniref:DNA polymerase subunit gamma-1, mitochondrial isoform X2 n=1 Tax=Anthonomus grandis grandis TaxID=2921223 RepID=UPI0021659CC7|nr:DNA polymerase subunit gamma-1, mitochondrial isoform X2 [Anthonomus grandis grandis]
MALLNYFPSKRQLFRCESWLRARRFYYEISPRSRVKIFAPNPDKKLPTLKKKPVRVPGVEKELGPRTNPLGIQMLSKAIFDQVFLEGYKDTSNNATIETSKKELLKHNMKSEDTEILPDVDFIIPPLKGQNIEEHFLNIGEEQVGVYRELVLELLKSIPNPPKKWVLQDGWTRYEPGQEPMKVDYPLEEALVFDVEVCMMVGKSPTLATAVSNKAWYSWVSSTLIDGTFNPNTSNQYHMESLIPLESQCSDSGINLKEHQLKPKIIIGHNVSYDRARIKEQYWPQITGTRFIDTMSLHVCVSGLTSYQRAVMKSSKFIEEDESWKNSSSLNNLVDVYNLYCGKKLSKETRNIFVEGTLTDIKENFQNVMSYCSTDVKATYEILKELFPLFLNRFPHPVTLAGMLELGTAYLPVNQNWNRYVADSEQSFEDLENEGRILLARRADQACQLLHNEEYKKDLWLWDEDWEVKDIKMKNELKPKKVAISKLEIKDSKPDRQDDEEHDELEEKFRELWKTSELLPKVKMVLPGYPNWYRKLCPKLNSTPDWVPGPYLLSTSMKITPKLLSLTWEGYPLHHLKDKGWGFLVPFSNDVDLERKLPLKKLLEKCPLLSEKESRADGADNLHTISKAVDAHLMRKEFYSRVKKDKTGGLYKGAGIWCNTEIEDCCWFFKLPHKDGAAYNVGNPLAKDFLNKFSENVLAGDSESAEEVLTIARKLSYWRNNRSRILEQMIVWFSEHELPKDLRDTGFTFGAIIPQVVVCGTLTRRAMEPTWMTASNAHKERIGSELRSMVQAPPGYNIVGADVDSQELWIASVLGDADHAKMHGSTPFGWMTLSGTKAKNTDMHSVTAQAVGISREHAKVINYARIYGAGQQFAERLLSQFNPSMGESEARNKALKMFTLTKGKKIYFLKPQYLTDFADKPYNKWQAFELAKACGKTVHEMFLQSKWIGGTESAMFNRLEQIANSPTPCTPFLGGRLTRALEPKSHGDDKFLTTRVNWVVQSGAVDFLHLMLTCMKWIMGDKIRFCISFHDEVRYIVPEQYKYQAALALHVSNLLTRSFCSYRLGMPDLPQAVAFFSSVEVDTVLRKECDNDCETPSNPHGLKKGYGIDNGESLNIYQAIEKAKGNYACWYNDTKSRKFEKRNVKSK